MSGPLKVRGADKLEATTRQAADELGDLTGAAKRAGDVVVGAARGRAPRRSGALAGSLRAVTTAAGIRVAAGVVYAGPVHWGWPARGIRANPFLSTAATSTEGTWIGFYSDAVVDAVGKVKGA